MKVVGRQGSSRASFRTERNGQGANGGRQMSKVREEDRREMVNGTTRWKCQTFGWENMGRPDLARLDLLSVFFRNFFFSLWGSGDEAT